MARFRARPRSRLRVAVLSAKWPSNRGAALVTVLLFSALLASLLAVAMASSLSGARAAAIFLDSARADLLSQGVGNAVAFQVATAGADRKRGGAFSLRLTQADLDVDYVSESARVDVNQAPIALIGALLAAAGAEASRVASVTSKIAAFRQTASLRGLDKNAKAPLPSNGADPPPSSDAAHAPLPIQSPLEVVDLWGLPPGLARRILPELTVANGSPAVDPLLSDRLLLSALLGDDARVDSYIERRQRGFASRDLALDPLPTDSKAFASFDDAPALRVHIRVVIGGRFTRRYEMVVRPMGAVQPPRVLSWQPIFEPS